MQLVFDIETDDLKATLVHCIVAQDVETGEIFKFPPVVRYTRRLRF